MLNLFTREMLTLFTLYNTKPNEFTEKLPIYNFLFCVKSLSMSKCSFSHNFTELPVVSNLDVKILTFAGGLFTFGSLYMYTIYVIFTLC